MLTVDSEDQPSVHEMVIEATANQNGQLEEEKSKGQ